MSRINTTKLSEQVSMYTFRANIVRNDPAVVKSVKQAVADIKTARESSTDAFAELRGSWARSAYHRR